jgi:hypothetical protein
MGSNEFERVMAILLGMSRHRPFSARSIAAARLVLVMGASVSEAAVETGLARQVVHKLMLRIRSRLEVCQVIGSRLKLGFLLQMQARWSN